MQHQVVSYRQSMDFMLFDKVRRLNLPLRDFAIFGSGPLAIRGIIPACNDLDILCRRKAWEIVRSMGKVEFLSEYNVTVASMCEHTLTFGTVWGIGDFDVDELIDTAEIISGLPFVQLEHVIRYKKIRLSEKDLLHLDAIAALCQTNQQALVDNKFQ
jgi:hypothetical protein